MPVTAIFFELAKIFTLSAERQLRIVLDTIYLYSYIIVAEKTREVGLGPEAY